MARQHPERLEEVKKDSSLILVVVPPPKEQTPAFSLDQSVDLDETFVQELNKNLQGFFGNGQEIREELEKLANTPKPPASVAAVVPKTTARSSEAQIKPTAKSSEVQREPIAKSSEPLVETTVTTGPPKLRLPLDIDPSVPYDPMPLADKPHEAELPKEATTVNSALILPVSISTCGSPATTITTVPRSSTPVTHQGTPHSLATTDTTLNLGALAAISAATMSSCTQPTPEEASGSLTTTASRVVPVMTSTPDTPMRFFNNRPVTPPYQPLPPDERAAAFQPQLHPLLMQDQELAPPARPISPPMPPERCPHGMRVPVHVHRRKKTVNPDGSCDIVTEVLVNCPSCPPPTILEVVQPRKKRKICSCRY